MSLAAVQSVAGEKEDGKGEGRMGQSLIRLVRQRYRIRMRSLVWLALIVATAGCKGQMRGGPVAPADPGERETPVLALWTDNLGHTYAPPFLGRLFLACWSDGLVMFVDGSTGDNRVRAGRVPAPASQRHEHHLHGNA